MAVASYHDSKGQYPPPYVTGPDGRPWHSWRILILPYIEHSNLYEEYRFDEPWDGPNNRKLADRMPKVYAFHRLGRPGNTTTNYLAVVGEETVWQTSNPVTADDVTDGLGTTILVVENNGAEVHWMEPRDLTLAEIDLRVNSPAGVSSRFEDPAVAMLNGQLHRLRPGLSPAVLRAMLTIRGGEQLEYRDDGDWALLEDGRQRPWREP